MEEDARSPRSQKGHAGLAHDQRDQNRRKPVACNQCNKKKIKCEGMHGDVCVQCKRTKQQCTWRNTDKRIAVSKQVFEDLQERVRELEAMHTVYQSGGASTTMADDEEVEGNENALLRGKKNLSLIRSGEHQFVGPSASTFLASLLGTQPPNLSFDVNPQYDAASWLRRTPIPTELQVPPLGIARSLFNRQYLFIGTIFSFVNVVEFDPRLVRFYQEKPNMHSQESCLEYCQILMILAFGDLYSPTAWRAEGPPGFNYFKQALNFLPEAHEEGSVLFVEVLSLVGYYLAVLNRRDAAYLYIGMALRMATSLGLHQELSQTDLGALEREHRRRVFWSVYSMDRIISVKWGNPISIHDDDIGVTWPSPLEQLDVCNPFAGRTLSLYSQLSKILGKIGEIYRKTQPPGTNLLVTMQLLMNELSAWLISVPAELKFSSHTSASSLSREAISMMLHFYQCVNMTVRPLLFSVVQKRLKAIKEGTATASWKDNESGYVVALVENTIAAAALSTQITSAAADRELIATYGFMDGEHVFSAALVLVMVNVAFEYHENHAKLMKTAMHVLKSMAEKGNRYVEARHALLNHLRSTIRPRYDGQDQVMNDNSNDNDSSPQVGSFLRPRAGTSVSEGGGGGAYLHGGTPGFFIAPELQDPNPVYDFGMGDNSTGGLFDEREFVQYTQILSEQIYDWGSESGNQN